MTRVLLATGPSGTALTKLVDLLRVSPTLQQRTGITDPDELEEKRIWYPWHETPFDPQVDLTEQHLPLVVIQQQPTNWDLDAGGDQNHLFPNGGLLLVIVDNDNFPNDQRTSIVDFSNLFDGIITELAEASAQDDNLAIVNMTQQMVAMQSAPTEADHRSYWWTKYLITWDPI